MQALKIITEEKPKNHHSRSGSGGPSVVKKSEAVFHSFASRMFILLRSANPRKAVQV
jgi:hypothetical protein